LISYLRFGTAPLEERYRPKALARLKELRATISEHVRPPAGPEAVIGVLDLLAKTFQVSLPEEDGQLIYAAVLGDLPEPVLKKAVIEICKTHKYKTMPLPAEILEAANAEAWQWRWSDMTLARLIAKLEA
jgi:hypothetical protein